MKHLMFALASMLVATLACVMSIPIATTPGVTQEAVILPAADVNGLESVNTDIYIDTCKIVAITDTNIRSCGNVACEDVGDILEGQIVTGTCSGDWITIIPFRQYACIPALTGTGGCETVVK